MLWVVAYPFILPTPSPQIAERRCFPTTLLSPDRNDDGHWEWKPEVVYGRWRSGIVRRSADVCMCFHHLRADNCGSSIFSDDNVMKARLRIVCAFVCRDTSVCGCMRNVHTLWEWRTKHVHTLRYLIFVCFCLCKMRITHTHRHTHRQHHDWGVVVCTTLKYSGESLSGVFIFSLNIFLLNVLGEHKHQTTQWIPPSLVISVSFWSY